MTDTVKPRELAKVRTNSLYDLVDGLTGSGAPYGEQTISLPHTLAISNNYVPVSLNRILLSYAYLSQGLVQTVTNQPVQDAFRGGVTFRSTDMGHEDSEKLTNAFKRPRSPRRQSRFINPNAAVATGYSDQRVVMDVCNWARLYGGAGLIINTNQNFSLPLDVESIGPDTPLEFISADRWELILQLTNIWGDNPVPFNFYGLPLHRTRVVKVLGAEAPSYIRLRLQGWGMSEIERCIRAINSFVKFENVIFELIDEAKVDVYKIDGFNDSLITGEGTAMTQQRIMLANRLKNYLGGLAMDKNDDWNQKQITWSGLAEIWEQLRLNLSSALKIPMNKLFGESATGFGGGQDALENYNSIVEGVREQAEPVVFEVAALRCKQMFGYIPEHLEIEWAPLKILDGVQAEEVKTKQQARAIQLFQQRLVTGREVSQILRAENLLRMDTEVSEGLRDVEPQQPNDGDPSPKAQKSEKPEPKPEKK